MGRLRLEPELWETRSGLSGVRTIAWWWSRMESCGVQSRGAGFQNGVAERMFRQGGVVA